MLIRRVVRSLPSSLSHIRVPLAFALPLSRSVHVCVATRTHNADENHHVKANKHKHEKKHHAASSGDNNDIANATFESLGITHPFLLHRLMSMGINTPTDIQKKCMSVISSRQNVLIGAQTGSGKTLTYLLPILQKMLTDKIQQQNQSASSNTDDDAVENGNKTRKYPSVIILQPSNELCEQTLYFLNQLLNSDNQSNSSKTPRIFYLSLTGQTLLKPVSCDILITTPFTLSYNHFHQVEQNESKKNTKISREQIKSNHTSLIAANDTLLSNVHTLVLDEVDLMLEHHEKTLNTIKILLRAMLPREFTTKHAHLKQQAHQHSEFQHNLQHNIEHQYAQQQSSSHKRQFIFVGSTLSSHDAHYSTFALLNTVFPSSSAHALQFIESKLHVLPVSRTSQEWYRFELPASDNNAASISDDADEASDKFIFQTSTITILDQDQFDKHSVQHKYHAQMVKLCDILQEITPNPSTTPLSLSSPMKTLVFCNSSFALVDLQRFLTSPFIQKKYPALAQCRILAVHGKLRTTDRLSALKHFGGVHPGASKWSASSLSHDVLLATSLLARGSDFHGVTINNLVQFQFATSAQDYIHRIGRIERLRAQASTGNKQQVTYNTRVINMYTSAQDVNVENIKNDNLNESESATVQPDAISTSLFGHRRMLNKKQKKSSRAANDSTSGSDQQQ